MLVRPLGFYFLLKFIPVRGRKHIVRGRENAIASVEIYPREGTETFGYKHLPKYRPTLRFIPVRGRKPIRAVISNNILFMLKFIPVRGRKLFCLAALVKLLYR